jgi:phosphoglycerate-specific signal transduction histidine kinase
MSDETKKTDETNEPSGGGGTETPKTFSQDELDAIINRRFAKYKGIEEELQAIKAEREKLAQQEKERTEKELAEQNKWKELADQRELEIAKLNDELTPFKERWEAHESAIKKEIDKLKKDLSDDQKDLLEGLDVEKQMKLIQQFKGSESSGPGIKPSQGGKMDGVKTIEEITKMRNEGNPAWKKHYQKYQEKQKGL